MMQVGVVIPAAGSGKRFGGDQKKQYLTLSGKPVIVHALATFVNNEAIREIILVVPEEDLLTMETTLHQYGYTDRVALIVGGKERFDSVYKGLKALSPAVTHVLIHDGARPLLSHTLLNRCLEGLGLFQGFTVAVPSRDTIKRVANNRVVETLKRSELMLVQTPQGFERQVLESCYQRIDFNQSPVTDDASLLEFFNIPVHIIEGEESNIKVTYPIDLILGEAILTKRGDES